jgi:DNA segregation ATPase FtsK/SpoIIIE, S-DNA-T family
VRLAANPLSHICHVSPTKRACTMLPTFARFCSGLAVADRPDAVRRPENRSKVGKSIPPRSRDAWGNWDLQARRIVVADPRLGTDTNLRRVTPTNLRARPLGVIPELRLVAVVLTVLIAIGAATMRAVEQPGVGYLASGEGGAGQSTSGWEAEVGHCDSSGTVDFTPHPRVPPPVFETADIAVVAPPEVTRAVRSSVMARLLPIGMAVAAVAMMAVGFWARSAAMRNPMFMMFPLMMLVSAIATALTGGDRRRGEIDTDRAEYLSYLSDLRSAVVKTAAAQRLSLLWCHPDPDTLWTLVGGCRMWERRAGDSDFCHVRVGAGTQRLATRLVSPQIGSLGRLEPVTVTALRRFLQTHSTISGAPIAIALRGLTAVTVGGDTAHARGLVRAMICQLVVLHSPSLLLIIGVFSDSNRSHWDWLKWLPHNQHPHASDGVGAARMVYPSLAAAESALAGLLIDRTSGHASAILPQLVVVVDGDSDRIVGGREQIIRGSIGGLTVLEIGTGSDGPATDEGLRLRVTETELATRLSGDNSGYEIFAGPDRMNAVAALTCARRLAAYRVGRPDAVAASSGLGWLDLVGVGDLASTTPSQWWNSRRHGDRLRVPIGTTLAGVPLELDIKEAAEKGKGPHGLCIGATGSGKSEFLRTVALGMIARHSPETLNLVLVDFKGGATFLGLERAPHAAAVITNLSDKAPLVARMRDALTGEMNRRQELLCEAGNLDSVAAYELARRTGTQLAALPVLLVIVDEFSELLSQHPDFADVFAGIGRLGRSLGMHLLLASQRLDEGRLRGLESHLSYRVCLKTLSANESRIALGTSDAYELPSIPGAGYLRAGTDELIRFQTACVSVPWQAKTQVSAPVSSSASYADAAPRVRLFTANPTGPVTFVRGVDSDAVARRTVLQAVIDRVSGHGPRAHEVWLPPLGAAPALDTVLSDAAPAGKPTAAMAVSIGIVDRPFEQRRTPLTIDLSGAGGNVAVVGAPQSGKSTALRTLVTALAVTRDPNRVQFYCLDFGGGALAALRSLPHVGAVAGRADPQLVRRTITELETIIRSREAVFGEQGIESMAQYRRLKARRGSVRDRFGDVFLVVDGWISLCHEFATLEAPITTLAAQGLSFGVHVVLSASRWAEIRPGLKDQIGTRIELRLGDPTDSELDRRRAQQVPKGKPGRGLSHDGLHMVIALPRLDGANSSSGLAEAGTRVGEMLRRRHPTCAAPPIPLLPTHVDHHTVIEGAIDTSGGGVLIGVEETQLRPVAIDFAQQGHLLILGDSECGKTAALRTLCREIKRTTSAVQSQLFIVDFRRTLLGVIESEHLGGYAISASALDALLPDLVDRLRGRMPHPDVTYAQLRARSWWSGPEIYVVVDDCDLVATAAGNPLRPLLEYLPHARDVGLHLLVARRSAGAARAMFEPLLGGLRDVGCVALMMSGSPDEGPLIGSVRPSPLPPGRGTLITRRGGPQLVQVAWSSPP